MRDLLFSFFSDGKRREKKQKRKKSERINRFTKKHT